MSNTLTIQEQVYLDTMNSLAGWFAGHVFGSHVTIQSIPEWSDETDDGRIISLGWEVIDGYFLMGTVHWHIDCPTNGGWVAGGTSIDLDEV